MDCPGMMVGPDVEATAYVTVRMSAGSNLTAYVWRSFNIWSGRAGYVRSGGFGFSR